MKNKILSAGVCVCVTYSDGQLLDGLPKVKVDIVPIDVGSEALVVVTLPVAIALVFRHVDLAEPFDVPGSDHSWKKN